MRGKILIAFFVFVLLISVIPYDSVKATSVSYTINFNGTLSGSNYPNGITDVNFLTKRLSGTCYPTATYYRGSGSVQRSFGFESNSGIVWWNLTYSQTAYLVNFSFYLNCRNSLMSSGNSLYFYFYNKTTRLLGSTPIISFNLGGGAQYLYWLDHLGNSHTGGMLMNYSDWNQQVYVSIDNNVGDVTYGLKSVNNGDDNSVLGEARNVSQILNGYRIDCIYITSACINLNYYHYIDDIVFTTSSSYSGSTSPTGCNDYSSYQNIGNNFGNVNIHQDIDYPYIEFCSDNKYSLLGEGFELLVGSGQYEMDSDVNNYQLYINGNYIGLASCFYQYDSENYILQFDIPSLNTSDELIVIDLVHTVISGGHYWNLALYDWGYGYVYGPPSQNSIIKESSNSVYINTVLDGYNTLYYQPLWKLYYSAFTSSHEGELPFTNNIVLVGFQPNHPQYNIPYSYQYKTIFFDVYTDNANGYYNLSVMKGNTLYGTDQYYPIKIYDYKKQCGFTPYDVGNYTVNLSHGTTQILHKHFNITTTTDTYSIWSFPNPSNPSSTYKIGVFLKYSSAYTDYFICGWGNPDNVNSVNLSSEKIKVGNLTNNVFYVTVDHLSNYIDYWRLLGTNDELFFTPLTPVEKHYIYTTVENYIRTSLTDGKGLLDTEFNIYGSCDSYASIVKVFKGTQAIYDVTMGSFIFPFTEHKTGTYKYDLKISTDTGWITLDSVTVSISEKKTSPEVGLILLPPPYSYIMGAIITIALMILPSIALGKIGISGSEMLKYVPVFSGTMGFILSCLIGLFPWYSIFTLLFVLILIIVVLYLSKNKQ